MSDKTSMKSWKFVILGWVFLSACQKVDPQVLMLGSGNDPSSPGENQPPPVAMDPRSGRITAGSGEMTSANYRLRGRVSLVPSHEAQSTSYRLKGTVRF